MFFAPPGSSAVAQLLRCAYQCAGAAGMDMQHQALLEKNIMSEIVRILTDDQGTITHLVTEDEERLSVEELAQALSDGENYYITFGEDKQYAISIVAEDGHLEPTVDDPAGVRSIWDLPQEEDPEESEIDEMFEELNRMGEFNAEGEDATEQSTDTMGGDGNS